MNCQLTKNFSGKKLPKQRTNKGSVWCGRRSQRTPPVWARVHALGRRRLLPPPQPLGDRMSDIDWNVELRKIVREYDGLPPERSRTQIRLQKIQEIVARDRLRGRLDEQLAVVGFWVRFALVGVLAFSLFGWPYGHRCGFPLVAFLLANVTVIAAGLALAVETWREQMVRAFLLSTLFVATAWTMIAVHTLPRFGYAPFGETNTAWSCPAKG